MNILLPQGNVYLYNIVSIPTYASLVLKYLIINYFSIYNTYVCILCFYMCG